MQVTQLRHCIVLALAWLTSIQMASAEGGKRYAILVGIDDYQSQSGFQPLKYAQADVEQLSKALLGAGYSEENIRIMVGNSGASAPTKANIYSQLRSLATSSKATANDSILLVFAGHGFSEGGKSYLCPVDYDKDASATTAIPVSDIAEFLARSSIGEKYVVIDACRNERVNNPSQEFDLLAEIKEMRLKGDGEKQGIVFLSSCLGGQKSIEDAELGHGVFMHFISKGIEGEADFCVSDERSKHKHYGNRDDQVSLFELIEYASNFTYEFVLRKYDIKQRPWADIHSTGDLNIAKIDDERRQLLEATHGSTVHRSAQEVEELRLKEIQEKHAQDLVGDALLFILANDRERTISHVTRAIDFYGEYYLARRLRSLLYVLEGNDKPTEAHEYYQKAIDDMGFVGSKLRLRIPDNYATVSIRSGATSLLTANPGDVLQIDQLKQHGNSYWLQVSGVQRKSADGLIGTQLDRPSNEKQIGFVELELVNTPEFGEAQQQLFVTAQSTTSAISNAPATSALIQRAGNMQSSSLPAFRSNLATNIATGNTPRLDQIERGIEAYNRVQSIVNTVSDARLPSIPNYPSMVRPGNIENIIRSNTLGRIPGGFRLPF